MNQPFYGLDFGTSNSVISIVKDGAPIVVPIDLSAPAKEVMQSILYFKKDTALFSGQQAIDTYLDDNAKRQAVQWQEIDTGEEKTVEIVGQNGIIYYTTTFRYRVDINKPGQFVQALKTTLREDSLDTAFIFDQTYSLEELIATILRQMKQAADAHLGQNITRVVLGRPVHYAHAPQDDRHVEERMQEAAHLAGFEEVTFLAEPIAAALSYLVDVQEKRTVLIFDFGGGTLDFSLVTKTPGSFPQIVATGGLPIGGNTFNEEIMLNFLAEYFGVYETWGPKQLPVPAFLKQSLRKWYELDHLQTPQIRDFLKELERSVSNSQYIINLQELINYDLGYFLFKEIEAAKKQLSTADTARIAFSRERLALDVQITREQFEAVLVPYEIQIDRALDELLADASVDPDDIDVVVTTGGSSLIPRVQALLAEKFGKNKVVFHDVFTGVGAGLALADHLR